MRQDHEEFTLRNAVILVIGPESARAFSEYFARNCFVGASFMPEHEGRFRHQIGVDRLMWGSDYPHLEGTWPNTMKALNATFSEYSEEEIRAILGLNAARAYGFDLAALQPIVDRVGPSIAAIRGDVSSGG